MNRIKIGCFERISIAEARKFFFNSWCDVYAVPCKYMFTTKVNVKV